jgi:predicted nucleic acid-binding protein
MAASSHLPDLMSDLVIFDTSVLVGQLRTERYRRRIETLNGLIRNCAVVMAELWRGVVTSAEREFLITLAKNHPVLTPTERNWIESGEILAKIRADMGFEPHKLRDLHFDVLIALTARSSGARLITSNRTDFEMIGKYRKFQLEIW